MKVKKLLKSVKGSFENGLMIYIPIKILTFSFQLLPAFLCEILLFWL